MSKQLEALEVRPSLYSRLSYHNHVATIHNIVYQTQNFSDIGDDEQQIIFSETIFAIDETKKNNSQFEHFFEVAEDQYKCIDGLVKNNKANCPADQLKFLLKAQNEARLYIIHMHLTKYNRASQIIKNHQEELKKRQDGITLRIINLRMEMGGADERIGTLRKELDVFNASLRESLDNVNRKNLTGKKAKAATNKLTQPLENINKKIAAETNTRSQLQSKIDILTIEQTSSAEAYEVLSKNEKSVTENYLRTYCNYRQNWIRDDGANANMPFNVGPLNFKDSKFILDGVDFSNIPITFAELASADAESISKIIGLGYKQLAVVFMKDDLNGEQKGHFIIGVARNSTLADKGEMIMQIINARPDDLACDTTEIIYNICDDDLIANKSYQIWLRQKEFEKDSIGEGRAESKSDKNSGSEKNSPDVSRGSHSKSETKKSESAATSRDSSSSPASLENITPTKPSSSVQKYSNKIKIWSGKLLAPPDKTYGRLPD